MAEIAVERKGTRAIWFWSLFFLLIVLVGWIVFARTHEAPILESERGKLMQPVRELSALLNVRDESLVIGRPVEIKGVRVLSVTGDRLFWVGESASRQLLVELDEVPAGRLPEDTYNANPGQTVTLYGYVSKFPGWETARSRWNANPLYRSDFQRQRVFIHANRLEITHRH